MPNELSSRVRTATTWSLVVSILMIAAGLLAIAVPQVAGIAIAGACGVAADVQRRAASAAGLAERNGRRRHLGDSARRRLWRNRTVSARPSSAGLASLTLVLAVISVLEGGLEVGAWRPHALVDRRRCWLLLRRRRHADPRGHDLPARGRRARPG